MTISYTGDICSSRSWSFLRVIFRWKGSIWKSVMIELVVWLVLYYVVMLIYKFALDDENRKLFTAIAQYTNHTVDYIPLTFMLGFFVKIVVDRWKDIFANIGFVDTVAHSVAASVRGTDPGTVTVRRNIMRYLCLVQVLVLRDISVKVRKRYPELRAVVDAGFLLPHEQKMLDGLSDRFGLYWLPMNWICQLCARMRETGAIDSDPVLAFLLKEIMEYRERLQTLCIYDWVPVPLAYPQVVFVAVRTYFMICLISRQTHPQFSAAFAQWPVMEMLYPLMTMLQLVFYMGWVKVAEALLNPLGEDDDDFETIFVIERNFNIAMQLADDFYDAVPEQCRDKLSKLDIKQLACTAKSAEGELCNTSPVTGGGGLVGSAVSVMPSPNSERRLWRRPSALYAALTGSMSARNSICMESCNNNNNSTTTTTLPSYNHHSSRTANFCPKRGGSGTSTISAGASKPNEGHLPPRPPASRRRCLQSLPKIDSVSDATQNNNLDDGGDELLLSADSLERKRKDDDDPHRQSATETANEKAELLA